MLLNCVQQNIYGENVSFSGNFDLFNDSSSSTFLLNSPYIYHSIITAVRVHTHALNTPLNTFMLFWPILGQKKTS